MSLQSAKIEKAQRNLLIGFLILSGLLLVLIFYFSLTKTVIEVMLRPETVTATTSITIQDLQADAESSPTGADDNKVIGGAVLSTTLKQTKTYEGNATGTLVDDYARGQVAIENHTGQPQPLVQTTRLLSAEGVLFRTQETVTVPAGGSVRVNVKADQLGKQGNIGPSRFTIVALWPGIQAQIFAWRCAGRRCPRKTTDGRVLARKQEIADEIKSEAFRELSAILANTESANPLRSDAVWINVLSEKTDHEIGDEVSSFTTTIEVEAIGTAFSSDDIQEFLKSELSKKLSENTTLIPDSVSITEVEVDSVRTDLRRAQLKVTATSQATPTLAHPMFDRKELTNKDQQDVRAAFSRFENVLNVNVRFSPFWVFRTPALEDHIEIEILPQLTNPKKNDTLEGDVTGKN